MNNLDSFNIKKIDTKEEPEKNDSNLKKKKPNKLASIILAGATLLGGGALNNGSLEAKPTGGQDKIPGFDDVVDNKKDKISFHKVERSNGDRFTIRTIEVNKDNKNVEHNFNTNNDLIIFDRSDNNKKSKTGFFVNKSNSETWLNIQNGEDPIMLNANDMVQKLFYTQKSKGSMEHVVYEKNITGAKKGDSWVINNVAGKEISPIKVTYMDDGIGNNGINLSFEVLEKEKIPGFDDY